MNDYFMGGDVSKGYCDFIILDNKKQIIEDNFQLDDTYQGHKALRKVLEEFYLKHPEANLYAALESTGGLENNWLHFLMELCSEKKLQVARINPLTTSAYYNATLTRIVNDQISARTIAEYMIACPEKIHYNNEDPYSEIRKLWTFLDMLKKQNTQFVNQLHIVLYTSFPFLVKYIQKGIPNWVYQLLLRYPSANKLAKAHTAALSKIPYISKKKAEKLIEEAKTNIGSSSSEATSFLIESTVTQILSLKKSIKQQKDFLEKQYGDLPLVKLLRTFKGIGPYSAIGLLVNIISVDLFPSVKNISSFFGVHPIYKQSGDGKWGFHMSKRGRSSVRAILYMVAMSASQKNPAIKEYYINQLKKGKSKNSALGICMHKILRIVFGMLKNNKPFDPKILKSRKEKREPRKRTVGKLNLRLRRFDQEDQTAPVSARQLKLRKKRKQSQSEIIA